MTTSRPSYDNPKALQHRYAHLYVYRLVHWNHGGHLAWHPDKRWTQFDRGWVYTYEQALFLQEEVAKSRRGGREHLLREQYKNGRWFAVGRRIFMYDKHEKGGE